MLPFAIGFGVLPLTLLLAFLDRWLPDITFVDIWLPAIPAVALLVLCGMAYFVFVAACLHASLYFFLFREPESVLWLGVLFAGATVLILLRAVSLFGNQNDAGMNAKETVEQKN